MKHNLHRRFTTGLLALTVLLGGCPGALAAEAGEEFKEGIEAVSDWLSTPAQELDQVDVAADWKFGEQFTTGSISDGSLIIEDQSGNDNDLKMQLYVNSQLTADTGAADWENYLSFSDESMTGEGGSLVFNGDDGTKDKGNRTGPTSLPWKTLLSTTRNLRTAIPWSSSIISPRTGPPLTSG